MFDLQPIDQLYESTTPKGAMRFSLFDKRVLLPLSMLPEVVARETGEAITEQELRERSAEGWFSLLPGAGHDGSEDGVPLYIPSRIGLFLKLRRDEGYRDGELRVFVSLEEGAVDEILTVGDFTYVDDDLEALILQAEGRVEALEVLTVHPTVDRAKDLAKAEKELRFLQRLRENGIPERLRPVIEKSAFRVRAFNDLTRNMIVDMDRGKLRAGFGPFVLCRRQGWDAKGFRAEGIDWTSTLRSALACAESEGEDLPIRVPGFVLRGERVTPTRTMRPAEYAALWKQHDIDTYLEKWSDLRGERRCLNCFSQLPAGANDRQRFCGDKCRNAAKQRRLRERNPEAVERAQKRYWESIELGDQE